MLENELSALQIKNAKEGKYRDGAGLTFEVKGNSKRWTHSYTWDGKQRELAIGKYPAMKLADARDWNQKLREAKANGTDPKSVLAGTSLSNKEVVTFETSMTAFYDHMHRTWVPEHRAVWKASLENHAAGLMDKRTASITEADVVATILPIWETKHETASRVLGRIEQIIDHAGTGLPNPCQNVLKRLPRGVAPDVKPREAMPWRDLPAFFAELRKRTETPAHALQLLLLTCCPRAGEVIPAVWWHVEAQRWLTYPKSGTPRWIPLTEAACELLGGIKPIGVKPDAPIFAARVRCASGRIGDDAMQVFLRDEMKQTCCVHGFRSSFMDWVAEVHPDRLMAAERALDHKIGNRVQRAYLRSDLMEQRRELANLWNAHLLSGT